MHKKKFINLINGIKIVYTSQDFEWLKQFFPLSLSTFQTFENNKMAIFVLNDIFFADDVA